MPRPKKTTKAPAEKKPIVEKLETMTQVDGKDHGVRTQIPVSEKKTLNEIWNVKFSKYKTNDPQEYLARLRKQTKLDLQQECIKIGLMPHDNRELMIERLYKECSKYIAAASSSNLQPKALRVSPESKAILARSGNSLV